MKTFQPTIIQISFIACLALFCDPSVAKALNGSITLSEQALAALQAQHKDFPKTGIQFEAWQVVYRDVKEKNGNTVTRIYLNQRLKNAAFTTSIGESGVSKSINFSVTGISANEDIVILYYFTAVPSQFQVFKTGNKLFDGSGRAGLQYASNVLLKKPNLKNYGFISARPRGTVADHTAKIYANTANIMPVGWLDAIGDFFEDLGQAIFEGGKTILGVVVDGAGTILAQGYGISVALFVDGYLPDYREITQAEYNWVNTKIFNNTLPPKSKIVITNLYGYEHRQFVFPVGDGHILMNLGEKGFANPMGKIRYQLDPNERLGEVFIHEMTHVWQINTSDDIKFVANALATQTDGASAYDYNSSNCDNGKLWRNFNLEQQAEIVRHCFQKREAGNSTSCQQTLVENHIRKGIDFPIPRTAECQSLITQITSKAAALAQRRKYLEETKGQRVLFLKASESPTGKPVWGYEITEQQLMADTQYKTLKAELAELNQKKAATNCK